MLTARRRRGGAARRAAGGARSAARRAARPDAAAGAGGDPRASRATPGWPPTAARSSASAPRRSGCAALAPRPRRPTDRPPRWRRWPIPTASACAGRATRRATCCRAARARCWTRPIRWPAQRLIVVTDTDGDPREARVRQARADHRGRAPRGSSATASPGRTSCTGRGASAACVARRQERLGALVLDDRHLARCPARGAGAGRAGRAARSSACPGPPAGAPAARRGWRCWRTAAMPRCVGRGAAGEAEAGSCRSSAGRTDRRGD